MIRKKRNLRRVFFSSLEHLFLYYCPSAIKASHHAALVSWPHTQGRMAGVVLHPQHHLNRQLLSFLLQDEFCFIMARKKRRKMSASFSFV
jgi:hypothetical protein